MKKLLLLILLMAGCVFANKAEIATIEVGGLYYRIDEGNTDVWASIVKPTEGNYAGKITLVPRIEYKGVEYSVNFSSLSAIDSPGITELYISEGFDTELMSFTYVFRSLTSLEKLYLPKDFERSFINLCGKSPKCFDVFVRTSGETITFIINRFNVFYTDGSPIDPYMKAVNYDDSRLYPTDGNTFVFANSDEMLKYGCILAGMHDPYYTFALYYGDKDNRVRTQPTPGYTGLYTTRDGIRYSIGDGVVALCAPEEGMDAYSGDMVVPATIRYDGVDYPVYIGSNAFRGSDITSVKISEGVTKMESEAFADCALLESVDLPESLVTFSGTAQFIRCVSLRAITIPNGVTDLTSTFAGCTALSEVILPESLKNLTSTFYGCTALSSIKLPAGVYVSEAFTGIPALVGIDDVSYDEDNIRFRIYSNCLTMDGAPIPLSAYVIPYNYGDPVETFIPDADGYVSIPLEFPGLWTPKGDWRGYINIYETISESMYLDSGVSRPSLMSLSLDRPAGVGSVISDASDASPEYYDLRGVRVSPDNLAPGLYVRRTGAKCEKIVVR